MNLESNIDSIIAVLPAFPRAATARPGEHSDVSRVYGEPIDVWVRGGKPARFVWRGRLYTVLGVLEHWVVSREWWQQRNPDPGTPAEHEFWRVEATPGQSIPAATYELRRDAATDRWLLARVWD
jgi:hypothetical protein